ncbi:MAG: hypothetical protein BRC25_01930 [Parcubacteria group bacterium SW_6_46_9]|nr:MAG: hypothetical protein BRC25_01930 [Parcubacteria group bacterium SW_6_46_9]
MEYKLLDKTESINKVFVLEDAEENKIIGKITKSLSDRPFCVDLVDVNKRAKFVYNLAEYLGLPSISVDIKSVREIEPVRKRIEDGDISADFEKEIFLRPYIGTVLSSFDRDQRAEIIERNISDIISYMTLHLLVGNYDKKTGDYLVTENKNVISIDHQLSGPHPESEKESIGAFALPFNIDNPSHTGWCLEGSGAQNDNHLSMIEYFREENVNYSDFQPYVKQVERLTSQDISELMDSITFKKAKEYKSYLMQRKGKIHSAIQEWAKKGFPLKSANILEQQLQE